MIISQTPLRVSFAGGGTDFSRYYREHEGAVVSSAIDKYVYVVVVPRFDELIIVNYTKKETVEKVADLKHEPRDRLFPLLFEWLELQIQGQFGLGPKVQCSSYAGTRSQR